MSRIVQLNNSPEFNKSLIKILEHSRKPVEDVARSQMRLVVEDMFETTPPAGGGKKGPKAKKAGLKTVSGHIQRVLQGVPVSSNRSIANTSESQIATIHSAARVAGRVPRRKGQKKARVKVPAQKLRQYIKKRQKAVGMLAAGWNAAARELGARNRYWPTYARQHNPPSQVKIEVNSKRIRIYFANLVRFSGGVDVMPRRLKWALNKRARKNEKIIAAYKGAARRQGFRVV